MEVEVNEANIDLYDLVKMTGNSREFLLSKAAEAAEHGTVLSCRVPDDIVLEQNVFDVYKDEYVDPRRIEECRYEETIDGRLVCVFHNQPSKYDVDISSNKPCLMVEPIGIPKTEPFSGKACGYSQVHDPIQGTAYICLMHGQTSKYDIANNPGMPCKAVDPE
jgi:hypothetical protein